MSTRIFRVVLGLKNLTALLLIALARRIITMLTGNSSVPVPSPSLLILTGLTDDFENANSNVGVTKQAWMQAVAFAKQKRKLLETGLTNEGLTVDLIAQGDKAVIESCGMTASDEPDPVHLEQVDDLSLTRGDNPGSVDAHWHAIPKSSGYSIEISHTAPDAMGVAPWVAFSNSTKSSATITGLTSGTNIWVHVCANGKGLTKGAFSDPAMLIVP